jgi:hypothetical protein
MQTSEKESEKHDCSSCGVVFLVPKVGRLCIDCFLKYLNKRHEDECTSSKKRFLNVLKNMAWYFITIYPAFMAVDFYFGSTTGLFCVVFYILGMCFESIVSFLNKKILRS